MHALKKIIGMLVFSGTLLASTVHAQAMESFTANVSALNNTGKEKQYRFALEYKVEGENVSGQFISYDSGRCGRERAFTGTLKGDVLQIRSEESDVPGCGRLNFTAKKESDGSMVGKMQFQGEHRDFVFKK